MVGGSDFDEEVDSWLISGHSLLCNLQEVFPKILLEVW